MRKIDESILEYNDWCKKLGIETISDINRLIEKGRINWLINVSEIWHEQKISDMAKMIKDNISKKKLILISGPSSSGKTTFANRVQMHLKVLGINAVSISLDNYYKNNDEMPLNADNKPDFEALESIDYRRFNENVKDLIEGREAILPAYDFENSLKIKNAKTLKLDSDEVIIVEGIHGLNPALSDSIESDRKFRIYCSALSALCTDEGVRIRARTTRLIRRLVRDYYFRNSDYRLTFDLWPHVEEGSQKNVFPFTDTADVVFNSSLLYELCVYKKSLDEVFEHVDPNDKDIEQINYLKNLVNSFSQIDVDSTPKTSLVREFVGGSTWYD